MTIGFRLFVLLVGAGRLAAIVGRGVWRVAGEWDWDVVDLVFHRANAVGRLLG